MIWIALLLWVLGMVPMYWALDDGSVASAAKTANVVSSDKFYRDRQVPTARYSVRMALAISLWPVFVVAALVLGFSTAPRRPHA